VQFEIVTLSRPGGRDYNEDTHGLWHDENFLLCLVADGAGGHGGGDVAAATVRDSVLNGFSARPSLDEGFLRQLLDQANRAIVARQTEGGPLAAMRSTVVLAVIDMATQTMVWAHSGDSRAYLFRGGAIVARTIDHSLVQQMVINGLLDEEGARRHPQRNVLLSALGSDSDPPEITVSQRMQLTPGDVLLLCSDGVWEPLGNRRLQETLRASGTAGQWTRLLDERIKAEAKPRHDNYTVLALWTLPDEDGASAANTAADVEKTVLIPTHPGAQP
jgi:serine/threonine protein phosphatase PrpC